MITITLTESEREQILFELTSALEIVSNQFKTEGGSSEELERIERLIVKFRNKPE